MGSPPPHAAEPLGSGSKHTVAPNGLGGDGTETRAGSGSEASSTTSDTPDPIALQSRPSSADAAAGSDVRAPLRDGLPSQPAARFEEHLADVLAGSGIAAREVLDLAEARCRYGYVALSEALASRRIDLRSLLSRLRGAPVESLCILPLPHYVEENAERFAEAFARIVPCDNHKVGGRFACEPIRAQRELEEHLPHADAYLVATSAPHLQELFQASIPRERTIPFQRFADAVLAEHERADGDRVAPLLARIRAARRPLVVAVGLYFNGYTPTFEALAAAGFDVFVVARSSTAFLHAGHFANLSTLVAFGEVATLAHAELIELVASLDRGVLVVPGAEDTFVSCSFNCRRAAAAYAYVAALVRTARVPTLLVLYDAVKPVVEDLEHEEAAQRAYRAMLAAPAAVCSSANTHEALDFALNALGLSTRATTFFRYPHRARELRRRRDDGLHLAVVGGLLGESKNPFWLGRDSFRAILRQGLHLHVYSSTQAPQRFRDGLGAFEREHLHLHAAVEDQQELLSELSQYHAGFLLNETSALLGMVAAHRTPFFRELAHLFLQTMASSAVMLFGAAGLPMLVNRTSSSVLSVFPRDAFLPIEPSELPHLRPILERIDWNALHARTRAARDAFTVEHHAAELTALLDDLARTPLERA